MKKRKIEGAIKFVTVRLESGFWYILFNMERKVPQLVHEMIGEVVGVYLEIARWATM
jgi:hypothetical protein